jgi:hypothetical protein
MSVAAGEVPQQAGTLGPARSPAVLPDTLPRGPVTQSLCRARQQSMTRLKTAALSTSAQVRPGFRREWRAATSSGGPRHGMSHARPAPRRSARHSVLLGPLVAEHIAGRRRVDPAEPGAVTATGRAGRLVQGITVPAPVARHWLGLQIEHGTSRERGSSAPPSGTEWPTSPGTASRRRTAPPRAPFAGPGPRGDRTHNRGLQESPQFRSVIWR